MVDTDKAPQQDEQKAFSLRGLTWWQAVLSVLPLVLVPLGGLVGGLFGGAAAVVNVQLARRSMGAAPKALAMIAVDAAAAVLYLVAAAVIASL